jgi:hypothetical protein
MFRVSKLVGQIDKLPDWVSRTSSREMQSALDNGCRNLVRTMIVRDVIYSALVASTQSNLSKQGKRSTFSIRPSPDLKRIDIEIPLEETSDGVRLPGKVFPAERDSMRQAIFYHMPALMNFLGPSLGDFRDEEADYQNIFNRYVKPTLRCLHIVDFVHGEFLAAHPESLERNISVDQILMRKAAWAENLSMSVTKNAATAVAVSRMLRIPSCDCSLVHIRRNSALLE